MLDRNILLMSCMTLYVQERHLTTAFEGWIVSSCKNAMMKSSSFSFNNDACQFEVENESRPADATYCVPTH